MSTAGRRARVVVVGLGPAGPELTTTGAVERLASLDTWWLRTSRHPAAAPYAHRPSFDGVYEQAESFDDVYRTIAHRLTENAADHGEVGYAVPGSPYVLERTVELLRADERVDVEVVPGMSFLDLAWGRLGVDPIEAGVRLVDGHRFLTGAAGATGPLLVAHCHAPHVLSDLKLAFDEDEPAGAVVLQRLGLPDEAITEVAWADLDRSVQPDHLTSVFIPRVGAPVAAELVRFDQLVRTLRERCPWDREQTHHSLTRYVVEEAHEVVDAINGYDPASGAGVEDLEEELGDLLYQVFFHATIAAQAGQFTLADVARGIHDKLERRHPHVFGSSDAASAGDLVTDWEEIKQAEKGRSSVMDGIPPSLPALAYAAKVLSRAERVGVTGPDAVEPALDLGRYLLGLVVHARDAGLDAEAELRRAVGELRDEVTAVERAQTAELDGA